MRLHFRHIAVPVFFFAPALAACSAGQHGDNATPAAVSLNWADTTLWFEGGTRIGNADTATPDVFYLLPTCVSAWNDSTGATHYNADPTNAAHRAAWQLSAELADTIFATKANLFIPYYRQAVFEGLEGEHAGRAMRFATHDAIEAFDYWLKHINRNRPFVLAGYSQGGKMVTEILKHIDDETYSRMIAAYVVGYGITADDTAAQKGHRISHILPACDSTATGVTVNFNSVTDTAAICQLLCRGNIACINPISWTTAPRPATLLAAGEQPKADDTRFPYGTAARSADSTQPVTLSVDTASHVLTVNNINPKRYFLPALKNFFPPGNLHLQELFFYGDCLRRNVILRCARFSKEQISKNRGGKSKES